MIMEKLIAVQKELKAPKNQRNNFGGYNYRSCEDILEAVKPILAKHGLLLTLSDEMVEVGGRVYVKATAMLRGDDGNVVVTAFAREDEERKGFDGAQITGSSSSYARKYALNGLFCIDDTKDSDATNTHEDRKKETVAKNEPTTEKKYKCAACGTEVDRTVAEYSYKKHGRILCRDCQKKV